MVWALKLGQFLMVMGGYFPYSDEVELVAIDPEGNSVPACLQNLEPLPYSIYGGACYVIGT